MSHKFEKINMDGSEVERLIEINGDERRVKRKFAIAARNELVNVVKGLSGNSRTLDESKFGGEERLGNLAQSNPIRKTGIYRKRIGRVNGELRIR